ncbi:MAG TPA: FlgO family outer membrane protein [Thermoanaerobaculia bacterium]
MSGPHRALLPLFAGALLCIHAERAAAQVALSQGIKDLAADILAKVTRQQKHRVAVLPFREINGRKTILDSHLSETLLTELFAAGTLEVVERSLLDKALAEVKLGQTGLIDSATARRVGKVAGVDAIVTGTITELRTSIVVNCRLFDAQTGVVFSAAQTRILKDADVMTLLSQLEAGTSEVPAPPGPAPPRAPSQPLASERENGFTIDLLECRGEGSVISCDLRITNRLSDRWIWLSTGYGSRTYLVDSQGRTCAATKSNFEWGVLPSGVPRRVTVAFSNCPRDATALSYVELGMQLDNPALGTQFKVPFRHRIPLVYK